MRFRWFGFSLFKKSAFDGQTGFYKIWQTRFHCEVPDFFEYIKPKNIDYKIRYRAIAELQLIIKNKFKNCRIKVFGSFYTN